MNDISLLSTKKNSKFVQLILRKIIKIVATRCQILSLKCTKFDFHWGSALDPAWGAYSAPPDSLARFKGPTSKGRGRGWKEGRGRSGRYVGEGKGKGGGRGRGKGKRGSRGAGKGRETEAVGPTCPTSKNPLK